METGFKYKTMTVKGAESGTHRTQHLHKQSAEAVVCGGATMGAPFLS